MGDPKLVPLSLYTCIEYSARYTYFVINQNCNLFFITTIIVTRESGKTPTVSLLRFFFMTTVPAFTLSDITQLKIQQVNLVDCRFYLFINLATKADTILKKSKTKIRNLKLYILWKL